MKLSKILLTAVAAVSVIGFASCGNQGNVGQKINKTNDSTEYKFVREWSKTTTKHYKATAIIKNENPTVLADPTYPGYEKGKDVIANATLGFLFGLEEDTETEKEVAGTKFYNFGIAAVRYNTVAKKNQWYVSWVKAAPETVFKTNNSSNFTDTLKLSDGSEKTFGTETEVKATWSDAKFDLIDDELVASIVVTANDDGSYKVDLMDEKQETLYDSATISNSVTGLTEKTEKFIGRYVTVYSGQTVQGSIKYKDIEGNVIPDYEEIVFD